MHSITGPGVRLFPPGTGGFRPKDPLVQPVVLPRAGDVEIPGGDSDLLEACPFQDPLRWPVIEQDRGLQAMEPQAGPGGLNGKGGSGRAEAPSREPAVHPVPEVGAEERAAHDPGGG